MQHASKNAFWQPGTVAPDPSLPPTAPTLPTSTSPSLDAAHKLLTLHSTLLFSTGVHLAVNDVAESLGAHLATRGWASTTKRVYVALPTPRSVEKACNRIMSSRNVGFHRLGLDFIGRSLPSGDLISASLSLVFFTYSTLVNALRKDPTLNAASLVIVSANNGTNAHILLALLRLAQRARPQLRLVVCCCDALFVTLFANVPRLNLSVQHPRQTRFVSAPVPDALSAAVAAVADAHAQWRRDSCPRDAHVLVFAPDASAARDIAQAVDAWARLRASERRRLRVELVGLGMDCDVAADTGADGAQIVYVTGCSRCATIAGTVRTRTVIDCGLSERRVYSALSREFQIGIAAVSRGEADLRAEFASTSGGRGLCLRLYTELYYKNQMASQCVPDILVDELSRPLLDLKSLGVDDIANFDYITIDPPRAPYLDAALERLFDLGALSATGMLTPIGRILVELPFTDPALSRCVVKAGRFGVHDEVLAIACVLHENMGGSRTLFHKPASRAKFAAEEGDLVTTLNVFRRYCDANRSADWCRTHSIAIGPLKRAYGLFRSLKAKIPVADAEICSIVGRDIGERVCRTLAEGYFIQAARRCDDEDGHARYITGNNTSGKALIHPASVVHGATPEWIVYKMCVKTGERYLREVTVVRGTWLTEIAPKLFEKHDPL